MLQGRLEGQAPEIDSVVYLTDCDPSALERGTSSGAHRRRRGYDLIGRREARLDEPRRQARLRAWPLSPLAPACYTSGWLLAGKASPVGPCPLFVFRGGLPTRRRRARTRLDAGGPRARRERGARATGSRSSTSSSGASRSAGCCGSIIDRPDRGRGPETPEDAVGIEDCQRVSQDLSALLDVEDELGRGGARKSYTLEVSSPGLDRPLRHEADYRRFAGRLAKIVTREPIERPVAFAGRLAGVDDGDAWSSKKGADASGAARAIKRGHLEVEF